MTPALSHLAVAAAFWILLHLGLAASPLRARVVAALGQRTYLGLFSALSAIGLIALIWTYRNAMLPDAFVLLRPVTPWMLWIPAPVMPFALILLVGSLTTPNPTSGQGGQLPRGAEPATGIMRVTRHPMLWSYVLWSLAHLVANGDAASLMLFGSVFVVAVNGMHSIDRKRARTDAAGWVHYTAATSILPFGAIAAGRNRFVFAEYGWGRLGLALGLWILLVLLHPLLLGVPALPG
jgi:uncharacterized membrane protein